MKRTLQALLSSPFLAAILAIVLLAGPVVAAAPDPYRIELLDRTFVPTPLAPSAVQALTQQGADLATKGQETVHVLVQLHELPSAEQRNELWRDGLDLGAYATGSSWIAAVPAARLGELAVRPDVRWLAVWDAAQKLHPRVRRGEYGPWTIDSSRPEFVMLMVQLHHDVPLDNLYKIADKLGAAAQGPLEGLHGMTVWVPRNRVAELAQVEDVLWVEEGPLPLSPTNDGARATLGVNTVAAAPYSLDGTGVRVLVFDGGAVRATHETFNTGGPSRVTLLDATAANDHPTHVAGTVGGDGAPTSTAGRGRGMAPDVTMLSAGYEQTLGTMLFWDNAGDIQADYALARNTHNADFATNSIGSNTASNGYPCAREGDYGTTSNLLDGIVRGDNPTVGSPVIMTWANGNERSGGSPRARCGANYLTTAEPSCAKNPIQVGALNSDGSSMTGFSSWGPCDDGRLKPIVSAPGCETGRVTGETFIYSSLNTSNTAYGGVNWCGTSMATPATAGVVAMLIEDWRARGFGGANARPLPALVKAMLIHTARDLGTDGPDFQHGYGLVDAKGLIDLLRAGNNTLGTGTTNWGTDSATNASLDSYVIAVPAGTGELKVSLAWDDAAAAAFAANAVVNNLDLELVAPDTTLRRPFILSAANPTAAATTGVNNLDNQEQVVVANPAAGNWTVRVRGTSVPTGPQTYGLAYSTKAATGACTTTNSTYEAGNDGWTLTGTTRVASPAAGHGSFSLSFGNAASTTHEATLDVAVPAGVASAKASFWWYMTTNEVAASGFGWDFFTLEIRNTSNVVLAVVDSRSDGYRASTWQQHQNVDLTPWAGSTVRLAFRAVNDSSLTTRFWADDVAVTTCAGSGPTTTTFISVGAQDGYVNESSENSNTGGTLSSSATTTSALRVGDTAADNQIKAFASFDTSAIPDGATILSATLRLLRGTAVGTNPFTTHGTCRADIQNGTGFGGSTALAVGDFQAAATATNVATMSNPAANLTWSEGVLNAAGLTAINKTGTTQLRVYLTTDDNDDLGEDYIGFYSGENATAANRPQLVVTYQ